MHTLFIYIIPCVIHFFSGGDTSTLPYMDGINVWPTISEGNQSPRFKMLHNIDPILNGASVRFGDWKLLYSKQFQIKDNILAGFL